MICRPNTDCDICYAALVTSISTYVEKHGVEPIGVLYSVEDHVFIMKELMPNSPLSLRWQVIPGFPPGAWVVYGPEGFVYSQGA
jgi:hypothetical protein